MKITKEELKDIALDLFLEKGYDNVTIQDICKKAGITKPTFYNCVNSKEDLILILMENIDNAIIDYPHKLLEVDSSYEQVILIFVILMKSILRYGYGIMSQIFIANMREDRQSFEMSEALIKLGTVIIGKAQANKEIWNPDDPEKIFYAMAHAFFGYMVMWCVHKDKEDYADECFSTITSILGVFDERRDVYKKFL